MVIVEGEDDGWKVNGPTLLLMTGLIVTCSTAMVDGDGKGKRPSVDVGGRTSTVSLSMPLPMPLPLNGNNSMATTPVHG